MKTPLFSLFGIAIAFTLMFTVLETFGDRPRDSDGWLKPMKVQNYFLVVDDEGHPIPGAYVESWSMSDYRDPWIHAWTDETGQCSYREPIMLSIDICASKPGYYQTFGSLWCATRENFMPPTNRFTIVLRKIRNPIEIPHVVANPAPLSEQPYGFDLLDRDWVSPRGSGHISDVMLSSQTVKRQDNSTEYRFIMEFPNEGDGIMMYDHSEMEGLFVSRFTMPINGIPDRPFTNRMVFVEHQDAQHNTMENSMLTSVMDWNYEPTKWSSVEYIFRIRSGEAEGAYYGYMEGFDELVQWRRNPDLSLTRWIGPTLIYRINMERGSRNIENSRNPHYERGWHLHNNYRPPPTGPVGDFFELPSRSVDSHSNSLGMRISDEDVGGVRFALDLVRNRDFLAFRRDHDSAGPGSPKLNRKDRPVVMVTAEEAEAFCVWLTAKERAAGNLDTAHEYRLPTAGEWLLAAGIEEQGMSEDLYPWGQDPNPSSPRGNYADRSYWKAQGVDPDDLPDEDIRDDGYAFTSPVGHFQANPNGLYDMGGNVWEICYAGDGPEDGYECRGGSWRTQSAESKRLGATRTGYDPSYPADDIGFRVVIAPVPENAEPASPPATEPTPSISLPTGAALLPALGMVEIAPGSFWRTSGVPTGKDGEWDVFAPVQLTIGTRFWMGGCEVTQALYESVMGTNPCTVVQTNLPVDRVSWHDATDFCRRLTEFAKGHAGSIPANHEFRLPTEAEWEYACLAGAPTQGDDIPEEDEAFVAARGWYEGNSGGAVHAVAQKPANAFGLHDMNGNVGEWCRDWYAEDYPPAAATDYEGPDAGQAKVVRGGSAEAPAEMCTSGARVRLRPSEAWPQLGFRIVLAPERE